MPQGRGEGRGRERGKGSEEGRECGKGSEEGRGRGRRQRRGGKEDSKQEHSGPPHVQCGVPDTTLPFPVDDLLIKLSLILTWLFYVDPSCDASRIEGKFLQQQAIVWFAKNHGFPSTEQLDEFKEALTSTLTRHIEIITTHQSNLSCDWSSASLLTIAGLLSAKSLDASMPSPLTRHGIAPYNILQFLKDFDTGKIGTTDLPGPTKGVPNKTNLSVAALLHHDNFVSWLSSPPKKGDEKKRPEWQKKHCLILLRSNLYERAHTIWANIHLTDLETKYQKILNVPSDVDSGLRLKECKSLTRYLRQFIPYADDNLFATVSGMHPLVLKATAFTARDRFCSLLPVGSTRKQLVRQRFRKSAPKSGKPILLDVRMACVRSLGLAMHLSGIQFTEISVNWVAPDITALWQRICAIIIPEHPEFALSKEWRQKVVNLIATNLRFVDMITVFNKFILKMCAQALSTCCNIFTTCDSARVILPHCFTIEEALAFPIHWFGGIVPISYFIKIVPDTTEESSEVKNSPTRKDEERDNIEQRTKTREERCKWNMLPEVVRNSWKTLPIDIRQVWQRAATRIIEVRDNFTNETLHRWKTGPIPDIMEPTGFIAQFI